MLPCPHVITLLLPNNVESLSLQTYCQFALVKHLTYPQRLSTVSLNNVVNMEDSDDRSGPSGKLLVGTLTSCNVYKQW